jgi:hypothetical protein
VLAQQIQLVVLVAVARQTELQQVLLELLTKVTLVEMEADHLMVFLAVVVALEQLGEMVVVQPEEMVELALHQP